jgi:Spy/CpxP family protein refolding chaperone
MRKILFTLGAVILIPTLALAHNERSPYAGQQQQALKALSPDEIKAYLNGEGMGLAKAAELNHYPGPKHVLDLGADLKLSDDQRFETEEVYRAMHERAVDVGKQIIEKETGLDNLFSTGTVDESTVHKTVGEIALLQGELRFDHLQAHLKMKPILSTEQREKYDQLRGYQANGDSESHQHHADHHAQSRPSAPAPSAASQTDKPYTVAYYYKIKWGYYDEFIRLFKKNHAPVLKAQQQAGRIIDVKAYAPTFHGEGRADWHFMTVIVYKNWNVVTDTTGQDELLKKLFPDQDIFRREEQRRFELLEAHWDVPLTEVDLDR